MYLHIVILTLNEADNLRDLLPLLVQELRGRGCITVADGGSTDATPEVVAEHPDVRLLACTDRGRALQMNEAVATGPADYDALYFVHADTRPPVGYYDDLRRAIAAGYPTGCYRFRFDSAHPMLKINAFCTRFDWLAGRGGDQSLYLTRAAWAQLGGYRPLRIMEDYDIIQRIWAGDIPFRILPRDIVVSARKYRANSWLRVQLANWKVFRMYKAGAPEEEMIRTYRERLVGW